MNARLRRFLALLVVIALALAACGGDDDDDQAGQTETGTDKKLSGETVSVLAKWTGGELDAAKKVMAKFTEDTGIKVNLEGVGDDLPTILSTRVEGGNPPDIAQLPQPGLLTDLAKRGALKPIEDVVGKEVDERYGKVWRDLGSYEGTLYGVWFKAANKSTVWYDVKAWDKAGVKPPTTWQEWVTASQDLLDSGTKPLAVGGADGWVLSDWFENIYLRTAGAEKYDQLAAHKIPWTDPSVKTAFTRMKEMLGKDDFIAKGRSGALQVGFEDSVKLAFANREAATLYEGDFVGNTVRDETQAKPKTDYNFFAFPSIDGSKPVVVGGGDVVVMLQDKPAARKLLEYLATADAAEVWAKLGGFSSPNKDVDLAVYPDDISREAAKQLVEAETFRFDLSDIVPSALGATKGAGIWGRLQDWLANPADVDKVLTKLEAEAAATTKA